MPVAVLEAMAAGSPVLVSAATSLGDLVETYEAGVVVGTDPDGMQDGLTSIVHAPAETYQRMSASAHRLVSERFTWSIVADQMATPYHTPSSADRGKGS